MAAKKESPRGGATLFDVMVRTIAFCLGPGLPAVIVLLVVGLLGGGFYVTWHVWGIEQKVVNSPEYRLRLEGLEITPLPKWIKRDVRREAYDHARLGDPLLILDDRLAERLHNVFALHPWVGRVKMVKKLAPARVQVELEYRRPVCMVEVPGGLYPVDVEGTWLPSDFTPVEATKYPRLSGVDSTPMGSVGTRWGDARVVGGAEIADALGSAWETMQLAVIRPLPAPSSDQCTFELYTRGGTRIVWGRAPGMSPAGEVPAAEKVARLRHYVEEHNSLDGLHGPQEIDIRAPQGLQVAPRTKGSATK